MCTYIIPEIDQVAIKKASAIYDEILQFAGEIIQINNNELLADSDMNGKRVSISEKLRRSRELEEDVCRHISTAISSFSLGEDI